MDKAIKSEGYLYDALCALNFLRMVFMNPNKESCLIGTSGIGAGVILSYIQNDIMQEIEYREKQDVE